MTGGWVEAYPDDVKAILAEGHDLGNHSENHKNMSQLSDSECEEELMAVHRKVQELTGYEMFLFRPPYGDCDNDVINVAKKCGYYPIQWDVESPRKVSGRKSLCREKKSESTGFREVASPMDLSSSGESDFFSTVISG